MDERARCAGTTLSHRAIPKEVREVQGELAEIASASCTPLTLHVMEWAAEPLSVEVALDRVISRGGSKTPGPDGVIPSAIADRARFTHEISRALANQSFLHGPSRRVVVPKPRGGTRTLEIQNARARVADTAVSLYFRAAIDADLPDCSYGYRKGRGTLQAIVALGRILQASPRSTVVIGLDLRSCFGSVTRSNLIASLKRRFAEPRLIQFIGDLCAGGFIPHGSPLSPALADFYLEPLLWTVQSFARGVVYGDDFAIACESPTQARTSISKIVAEARKLDVSFARTKSTISPIADGVEFLGYRLSRHDGVVFAQAGRNARRDLDNALERVARLHRHSRPRNFIRAINAALRGWAEYFRFDAVALGYARRASEYVVLRWLEERMPYRVVWRHYGGPGQLRDGDTVLLDPTPLYEDFPALCSGRTGPSDPPTPSLGNYPTPGHRGDLRRTPVTALSSGSPAPQRASGSPGAA
jgi:RNA-directed DNA polymerase